MLGRGRRICVECVRPWLVRFHIAHQRTDERAERDLLAVKVERGEALVGIEESPADRGRTDHHVERTPTAEADAILRHRRRTRAPRGHRRPCRHLAAQHHRRGRGRDVAHEGLGIDGATLGDRLRRGEWL